MKKLLYPIQLNESSFRVQQLHLALAALGMPVPDAERLEKRAGETTLKNVRELQTRLGVQFDKNVLTDNATVAAIEKELKARGILDDTCMFTAGGKVVTSQGSIAPKTKLIAFDIDLKGAAVYRKVKNLDEIKKNGGFEYLDETSADAEGNYSITFYCEQFKHAERKKADIVVYALGENGNDITGRSQLVNAEDYSTTGEVRNLDVIIYKKDPRTEYERLMTDLNRFLEESGVSLYELSSSKEQIAFTAGELDAAGANVAIAAAAQRLMTDNKLQLSHELLYGLGRQNYLLDLPAFYNKKEADIRLAITTASSEGIIREFKKKEVDTFIAILLPAATETSLNYKGQNGTVTLSEVLSLSLPEKQQQTEFLSAVRSFKGNDYKDFWNKYLPSQPAFKDKPELVQGLLFTQQLTLVTGNHQPLVSQLQKNKKFNNAQDLLSITPEEWKKIIAKSGVPASIQGKDDEEKATNYAGQLQQVLHAAYPTQKINMMLEKNELTVEDGEVKKGIQQFLSQNTGFSFAGSKVTDFEKQIKSAAGKKADDVKKELMRMQRVFQVSPAPEIMDVLAKKGFDSARSIASVPQKTFIKMYGSEMGGDTMAYAVHERASYINTRSELAAMKIMEPGYSLTPAKVMGEADKKKVQSVLQNQLPDYAQLFGSPDICECEECRSVYGAAAYLVDLLRFLWRGVANFDGKTPLDMLAKRRPDLLYLPLTCENTDTLIPYVDIVNEIMEFYTVNGSLSSFKGFDTGEITAEELRADPQNFNIDAYKILKDAKYPFTLPYHQPLDVIRNYGEHLKTSRQDALKAMQKDTATATVRGIEAEALKISPEEYTILAKESFSAVADATALEAYLGFSNPAQIENMAGVRTFLAHSGMEYTDLVELLETNFINPYQYVLDFLQDLFKDSVLDASQLYDRFTKINSGALQPSADTDIMKMLNKANITSDEFKKWIKANFANFNAVITLYEPDSLCSLDTTVLRTINNVYAGTASSGINNATWSKIHRFIRLWRKLGYTIHETDLLLTATGETDINPAAISKLSAIIQLNKEIKKPLNQVATCWGNIDTYGSKSLYKKLFLNKTVSNLDSAFEANELGNYLTDTTALLKDHIPAILAAFRMSQEDLDAITGIARVIDAGSGNPRLLDINTDKLNLPNLSVIYRYAVLSKALKYKVPDFCLLLELTGINPFSTWDNKNNKYIDITPATTYDFYELAAAIKKAGFKPATLQYIFTGELPADSSLGLDEEKAHKAAQAIRETFAAIEQEHPDKPAAPLTTDILRSKLSLTFQSETVNHIIAIIDGSISSDAMAPANLVITIPANLASKYTYIKASGRITCAGIMSDTDRTALKALNATAGYTAAIDALYTGEESFLTDNFSGVFTTNMADAFIKLLDHPAQVTPATTEEKLEFVYDNYIPLLKQKLREDAISQHIASLTGLTDEAAKLLSRDDVSSLITSLAEEGFSAEYFSDTTWTTSVLKRTDAEIDFDWGNSSPDPLVPANNFSGRWEAYLTPPASGDYTLIAAVAEADESFKIYLDEALILEKPAANTTLSWEVIASLNASAMHRLKVEYAEVSGNAGITLSWKTATTAAEIIPASSLYPAANIDSFTATATLYHRAAKFISGFKLNETEVDHFITWKADFANIDFKALTCTHWQRISDYCTLREVSPQAQASLIDVFKAANSTSPAPVVNDLRDLLGLATAWDAVSLDFLVNTHFALTTSSFKNEIDLLRVYDAIKIITRTGISASTVAEWGKVETSFDNLYNTSQLIKSTVKAKYEEEDWYGIAGKLSDKIRENQKQALISHLLTKQEINDWGAEDADGLFEYFLIDVQMGTCMDTSRIVQANAAVQMFVNRCLLNLESDLRTGNQKGVSPDAIDADRWEWMKYYRVWEANRKVFLYPENWLEPEWRNDKSAFFKDLESELTQNDITDSTVETAFRNYLNNLNEVANLEVVGMFQENDEDSGELKLLHVFARTHNAPYKVYYRTWNNYMKWSAWEKVQADVRNIEDGDDSGVHLVPVIWKKRKFLFWPEFVERKEDAGAVKSKTAKAASEQNNFSSLEANIYWDVRLAWTEFADGKWTPKQLSKEFISVYKSDGDKYSDYSFSSSVNASTNALTISMWSLMSFAEAGHFYLTDIQSKVEVGYPWFIAYIVLPQPDAYTNDFEKRQKYDKLELKDDTYLDAVVDHRLLGSNSEPGFENNISNPFFYQDAVRAYFVRPVEINVSEIIYNPGNYEPIIPTIIDDSWYAQPHIPHLGPDDYMPGTVLNGGGFTDPVPFTYGKNGIGEFAFNPKSTPGKTGIMNLPMTTGGFGGGATPMMLRTTAGTAGTTGISQPAASAVGAAQTLPVQMYKPAKIGSAFGKYYDRYKVYPSWYWNTRKDTGLEFHTFYHPYSTQYVTNLNQDGVDGLLESDTTLPDDSGSLFENTYKPVFSQGFVQKPSDFSTRTYFKENVCFDVYGANSMYNWELFFHAPLYIATRLSRSGRYEEAMKWFHYIFNPTTDELPLAGQSETSRYWQVLPFKTTPADTLTDFFMNLLPNTNPANEDAIIGEWRDNPFDPHLVASNRPIAYMKNVVIKYVENLLEWGDSLFRQFTRETVNEALQIYVIANHILGTRPEFVPARGEIKAECYDTLKDKLDDFSNAIVQMENIFPYSSAIPAGGTTTGSNLLGVGESLYFCIPDNDKLLEYWDRAADRLFKIRHCMDINGVERKLALFAPPIDPAALIQAASQGLSLGSILADLSSPPPIYRFTYLIQKANDFCNEIKTLGNALLTVLEKKDNEELGRLKSINERSLLELMTAVKERQILDAKSNKENLLRARETAKFRLSHYNSLLSDEAVTVPAEPTVPATLTADSSLPADTSISELTVSADDSLVDSLESGVKVIPSERNEIILGIAGQVAQTIATGVEAIAGTMNFIPSFSANIEPFGCGASISYGGSNIAGGMSGLAKIPQGIASVLNYMASYSAKMASYIRREQDWTLQANLAAKEIIQLDKQITSAEIRIQIAEKDLDGHLKQIENAKEVEQFLQNKFTNLELYQWMKEQLFSVFKQSYNMSFDMAKKAEKCYKYETGDELASFIQYGYWDNSHQGLLAPEKLQMALRQMEKSYLEENKRELELRKNVSLAFVNPLALQELRQTGKCYVTLPEELFDMDFQGHYFRRIKSVSLSIPCIAGPLTTISCTLRLLKNAIRINTSMDDSGNYEHTNDEGVWIDDDRFRNSNVPVQSIAVTTGQADPGLFELNFRDERYLPFEGAGAISDWKIELTMDEDLRQFDYSTISDIIMHVSYTAREDAGLFKDKAVEYIKSYLTNAAELSTQPLMRMFSLRHEFSTEWYRFLNPEVVGSDQVMSVTLRREHFPFFTRERNIDVMQVDIMTKANRTGDYHLLFSATDLSDSPMNSTQISMPENATYGDMQKASLSGTTANIDVEDINIFEPVSLKFKHNTDANYHSIDTDPAELEDVFMVIHYKLSDS